jgi:hypothetical protein
MPITGNATKYIGTHLREERISKHRNLIYANAGTRIEME